MIKKLTFLIFLSLFSMHLRAQQKTGGKVTDARDNSPLPGVGIQIKGTSIGTVSDANGNFSIQLQNASDILVFSYTGFTTKEVTAGNQSVLAVKLSEKTSALNEVVVIGYGTARKSDLTGSVASITGDKLVDKPVATIPEALQGKIAGVDVSNNNAAPGASSKVRIRGIGSINSNIDPLYVVDGVIGVDPNSINPNDVATLEVLKDASSTAIYGSRGANGVIIINTKRGRKNGALITYEGNANVSQNYRHLPTLNSDQFVQIYNQAFANGTKFDPAGGVWAPPKALNHLNFPKLFDSNDKPLYNTNWEKETYKPSYSQTHQLNIQGGNEKSQYSVALGYQDLQGLAPTSAFSRYSIRFTMDNEVKSWLKIGGTVNVVDSRQRLVTDGNGGLNVTRDVTEEVPILPVKYPDGSWAGNFDIAGLEGAPNPVDVANNRYSINKRLQALGDFYTIIHFTKDLDFKTDFGYNLGTQKSNFYSGLNLPHLSQDQGGVASVQQNLNYYWQTENYLTWNKKINSRNSFTALLGFSLNQTGYERVRSETQSFIDDIFQYHYEQAGSVRTGNETQDEKSALSSFYARFTYNLADKYLFTATGRYDGSSRFGVNNKYAFFPSIGAAWRLSQEDFLKDSKTVSNLKIRASYGVAGNQEIGNYRSLAQIQPSTTVLNGVASSTLLPSYIGNPNLKWERSVQADGGIELGMFHDRISLTADYYNRVTKDLLLQAPIPWSAGESNANVYKNVGSVRNAGVELSLNTVNVQTKDLTWSTGFVFASNKNTVLKLNAGNADIFPGPNFLGQNYVIRVGQPIGSFYGMTRLGTYGLSETADAAKHNLKPGDRKYIYNADGSNYYSIIGRAYPKWTGDLSSTLRYKAWDFSFDIRFVEGVNTAANFKHSTEDRQTLSNSLATVLNGWTPTNQNTSISQVRNYKFAQDSHFDTWWVEDGSFIRGQNIMLGYSLPATAVKKLQIHSLRIYASVQNAFIITKYTGYDPEVDTFNSGYGSNSAFSQNLDFFSVPRPRIWNLGVQLSF